MQLKEAKKRQKPWESELTRLVLIVHAGLYMALPGCCPAPWRLGMLESVTTVKISRLDF